MEQSENIFVEPIGRGRNLRRALGVMKIIEGIRDSLLAQPRTPGEVGSVIHPSEVVEIPEPTPHLTQPLVRPWDVT